MTLEYTLVRSPRRKTLALQIRQGQLTVRAPHFLSDVDIQTFVNSKAGWINNKLSQSKQTDVSSPVHLTNGGNIWYLGQQITLRVAEDDCQKIAIDFNSSDTELRISLSKSKYHWFCQLSNDKKQPWLKKQLEHFFKASLTAYLNQRLPELINKTKLSPSHIEVKKYKARWGSCNSQAKLSFNYLLMMVPTWVIDYVIIHELCHLKHLNHSINFWQLVALFMPDYSEAKQWLKLHQHHLTW